MEFFVLGEEGVYFLLELFYADALFGQRVELEGEVCDLVLFLVEF